MSTIAGTGSVAFALLVGGGLAAWGGVLIGAPKAAFQFQHLLVVREAELSFFGVFTQWIGGAMSILDGAVVAGRFSQPAVGLVGAFAAAIVVLGLGIASFRYARRNWGESTEIVDHY